MGMPTETTPHDIAIPSEQNPSQHPSPLLYNLESYWLAVFEAMGHQCEIFMSGFSFSVASELIQKAAAEAWRIEYKYSRYVKGNIIDDINESDGSTVEVDPETARLIDYAYKCYEISAGKFDISSGVLRKAWTFDGSDKIPHSKDIDYLLDKVGLHKLRWENPQLRLQKGMEIDLGGIGKEYAVDRILVLLTSHINQLKEQKGTVLINFGGDMHCSGPQADGTPWTINLDNPSQAQTCTPEDMESSNIIQLSRGAIASSGDYQRYLLKDGVRYSHVLNPKTGWPVPDAPHSVTVKAATCAQAGVLATLALLEGLNAEDFLKRQALDYWVQR
jgi:thiamine biosynthesis lipoprotein